MRHATTPLPWCCSHLMSSLATSPPHRPKRSPDFNKLTSGPNLLLAWERLERAREPAFKWYWRPSLSVGLKARNVILKRISSQLKNDGFRPDDVCLFSEPKPSTLLRHKSIPVLGDQLVYQAIGNIVADRLYVRVKERYYVNIFGNLYSGPREKFFLQRWEKGYGAFNTANRRAFNSGKKWLVQFDFASFYDSVGHGVLERLLMEMGVGEDVCQLLCKLLLPPWSCAGDDFVKLHRVVLSTGIPQGPLASPIMAEVVLAYVDEHMCKLHNVTYLRYADDIRIWGDSQEHVRLAAAILDRLARNIGIFPQAKKFVVEEIESVEDILKEVSLPTDVEEPDDESFELVEEELKGRDAMRLLWTLVTKLLSHEDVEPQNVTEFKFLLWSTDASDAVAIRLCELLRTMPHLTEACCYYIERVQKPSPELLDAVIELINYYPGYPWVSGRLLRVTWTHKDELTTAHKQALRPKVAHLTKQTGIKTDCQLQGIAMLMCSELNKLRAERLEKWFDDPKTSWWAIVHVVLNVGESRVSRTLFRALLMNLLGHPNREVGRAAAHRLCTLGERIPNVSLDEHDECKTIFQSFGLRSGTSVMFSRTNHLYSQILANSGVSCGALPKVNWRLLLGSEYEAFDTYATQMYGETRASRDLFCQFLFAAWEAVVPCAWKQLNCSDFDHDTSKKLEKDKHGVKVPEMFRKNTDLRLRMPAFCDFMKSLHSLRHHGLASHRKNSFSNLRNRPISFGDMKRLLQELPVAWAELATEFPEP